MNLKVLVFPCGSEIGLEIFRALNGAKGITLFGGSSISDHGEFVYINYLPNMPMVTDSGFIDGINAAIKDHDIDYVFPAHDDVVLALGEAFAAGQLACPVLTSPLETCRTCRSKQKTHETFVGMLPLPRLWNSPKEVEEWPVFLKPEAGQGSQGVVKCDGRVDAEYHLTQRQDLLIFEYLPGAEYTVDCFTDSEGCLLFCGGRERIRIMNGISVRTMPARNDVFQSTAEIIMSRLKFRGPWFFQLKEDRSGILKLMEIAPRIAGSMGLYRNLGVNFALLTIFDALGMPINILTNDIPLVYDRALCGSYQSPLAFRCAYLDWDDCVLRGDRLDLRLVSFLYQCVNKGVRTVLLSRHAGDLSASLVRYRLQHAFSEVVHITDGRPKSDYINEKDAVYIDDSFAERSEVRAKTGLPVFAPDAVESLLEIQYA